MVARDHGLEYQAAARAAGGVKRQANAHRHPEALALQRLLDDSHGSKASRSIKLRLAQTQTALSDQRNKPVWLKPDGLLAAAFRQRKRSVGSSWRMDETYILVGGQWKYLYRAVDKLGQTVDFLLTARRDMAAARRFFERAIGLHDVPEKITIDSVSRTRTKVRGAVSEMGVGLPKPACRSRLQTAQCCCVQKAWW